MKFTRPVLMLIASLFALDWSNAAPAWDAPPEKQTQGQFWRLRWYERGLTNGNPAYESRFRINSPEASVTPWIAVRVEARENGMMLIKAEENLMQITGAELFLEMWGGHPGTANKRVTVNGRSTYDLPRVGCEEGHCTYFYPAVPLKISDLVNGYNAFQFAVDQGTTFWGHAMVDQACLRVALTNGHKDVVAAGLGTFAASVKAEPLAGREGFRLSLEVPAELASSLSAVYFQGWYEGYDENGNLLQRDWHGGSSNRIPVYVLGRSPRAPYSITWDTSLLPAQNNVAVRAWVTFTDQPGLVYLTEATGKLEIPERPKAQVVLFETHDMPVPFWSRAGNKKQAFINIDVAPSRIESAELHTVTWTGGSGTVKEYFKLNGHHYPIAEGSRHLPVYNRLKVSPQHLKWGRNVFELLSDTEHHGIEVCRPGPALMIRFSTGE